MVVSSRHYSPAITVTAVGDKFPLIGFKTSAAFLTSLSANLRLPDDDLYPSPLPTPYLRTSDGIPFPPTHSFAAMALSHDAAVADASGALHAAPPPALPADLPTLTTYPAASLDDKIAGLKLVADSIAQQRQEASVALLYHPVSLAVYAALLAVIVQRLYTDFSPFPVYLTTSCGVMMTALVIVRYLTAGYIRRAETINWDWLGEDTLIVTKWGETVIGAAVLGWEVPEASGKKGKKRTKGGYGLVRAWTVKLVYRGKGVGASLLEEAVEEVKTRGGDGIEFADEHAHHLRILPPFFNGKMDRNEKRAINALHEVSSTKGNFGRRGKN